MGDNPLFQGSLVRLAAYNADNDSITMANWSMNSEYLRLLDSDPARPQPPPHYRRYMDESGTPPDAFRFAIRALNDDVLIGMAEVDGIEWPHATGWVGMGIGESDYWGKGYGTDAMRVILRFAFTELGLYRINLNVFEYNQRAIHLYEKLGFKVEGHLRGLLEREGRRWDLIYMGMLRPEWQEE